MNKVLQQKQIIFYVVNELSEEEVQAIVYHDGQYIDDNASVAGNEEPLTLLLQYADSWSGFVLEKKLQKLSATG